MAISADTANRMTAALTHPGAGNEVITQLNNPTFVNLAFTGQMLESSADGITAHAAGGQPAATQLTAMINRVTTVATTADSVKLPAAAPGLGIVVINAGANSLNVFGLGSDQINALGAGTGLAVAATKVITFYSTAAGQWHSQLGG